MKMFGSILGLWVILPVGNDAPDSVNGGLAFLA